MVPALVVIASDARSSLPSVTGVFGALRVPVGIELHAAPRAIFSSEATILLWKPVGPDVPGPVAPWTSVTGEAWAEFEYWTDDAFAVGLRLQLGLFPAATNPLMFAAEPYIEYRHPDPRFFTRVGFLLGTDPFPSAPYPTPLFQAITTFTAQVGYRFDE